jgi:hypothetical protein
MKFVTHTEQGLFMYAPLFSSYSQKLLALKNTRVDFAVAVLLGKALDGLGVNPHFSYLNILKGPSSVDFDRSITLFEEVLDCVERKFSPTYMQGVSKIFNKRYSFAKEDRIKVLDLIAFEKIVADIVSRLTDEPSMELSRTRLRPLAVEEVEKALKFHLPGIDLDRTYVTGFAADHAGDRIVISSEKLVDHLLGGFDNDEIPYHSEGDHQGVYTVPYSGEEGYRHPQLTTGHLNDLLIKVLPDFLI